MAFKPVHQPRKRFGQNFLQDPFVVQNIVGAIDPKPEDRLIEIGPGLGVITKPLLSQINHLDVVEIDRDLSEQLPNRVAPQNNLTIHTQDILTFDLDVFNQAHPSTKKIRIVGNLPYNISTPLIFHLLKFAHLIEDMHFMLQKEVVERITAKPNTKDYGRLSIMTQYYCASSSLFIVPPEAFSPAPQVQSAFIRLIPHQSPPAVATNLPLLQTITRVAFSQRRKTLSNALKPYLTRQDFAQLHIDPILRPETLPLEEFVRMSNYIDEHSTRLPDLDA